MILSFLLFSVINIWTDRKKTAYAAATIGLSGHCEKISLNWNSDCDYRTSITTSILRWWILLVEFPLPFVVKKPLSTVQYATESRFWSREAPSCETNIMRRQCRKVAWDQVFSNFFPVNYRQASTKPIHQSDILSVCINFINEFDTILFIEINRNVILLNQTGPIDAREWWIY